MPKQVKPLTDPKCRNAKSKGKQVKLSDGQGLYLLVTADNSKLWRFDYTRPSKKRNTLSFGKYPAVSLTDARGERDRAKSLLAKGIDPADTRKASAEDSFEPIALEWIKTKKTWSNSHAETTLKRLENNLFPWLDSRPIKDITPPELLSVLRRIEARGAIETAHRCRSIAGQVFRYAIATGRAERDSAADLRGALQEVVSSHHAAITDPEKLSPLLNAIDQYKGHVVTRAALKFAPLVFQRPGELRYAEWSEIDLNTATWSIPVERMKLKKTEKIKRAGEKHIVPLSLQAVEVLEDLFPLTGQGTLVFPSARIAPDAKGNSAKPLSENTLNAALRNMGFDKDTMTTHGWRAVARSLLDEILGHKPTAIEKQLFHAVSDPLGESYNRAQHFDERRQMMQRWADYLDGLKEEKAKVIPIDKNGAVS